jgi:hypothetical protein
MSHNRPVQHHWGLGLKDQEVSLVRAGATEIDLIRDRMPLLNTGDRVRLVDWSTEEEIDAEVLSRFEMCCYRLRIAGTFEPIENSVSQVNSFATKKSA